jgi:hypothetical protein
MRQETVGASTLLTEPIERAPAISWLDKSLIDAESAVGYSPQFIGRSFDSIDEIRNVKVLVNGCHLEQPSDEAIRALQYYDSRIEVINGLENHSSVWGELANKLDADFTGHESIAIRAVEASLDGLVTNGSHDTYDIRDILLLGDIKMRQNVNLVSFMPGQNAGQPDRIHHRVEQYGSQTDFYRNNVIGNHIDGVGCLFPVVLVYDTELISPADWYYSYKLPETPSERASVIQKAYVLDALIRPLNAKAL